jgi:hypothetical protein
MKTNNKDNNKNITKTSEKTFEKILKILIKEPFFEHTATSLALSLGITRQGLWKTLRKLSEDRLISLKSIANTKRSVVKVELEFKNLLALKTISLLLTKEALNNERWRFEFALLEKYSDFIILFGSMLTNPKEANDIDILIVSDKKNFKSIDEIKNKMQKSQAKKIHLIDLTKEEFKNELKKHNKAYVDALKKGVILFGQDDYVKLIGELG